jgi:hypothetical protein
MYRPDYWVPVKITSHFGTVYKILGIWSGSYLEGSWWRLNSGIAEYYIESDYYNFIGHSGSSYLCKKDHQGLNAYGFGILEYLERKLAETGATIEVMEDIRNENSIHVRPTS